MKKGLLNRWHLDGPLLFGLVILMLASLFVVFSASNQNFDMLIRQLVRMMVAFAALLFFARIEPERLLRWTPYIYFIGLVLLVLVLLFGTIGKGAQRWLNLGIFRLQPSEILKLSVPMMAAWVLVRSDMPPSFKNIFFVLLVIAFPSVLVILQPDLGTSILICLAGLMVLFLSGIAWRWIFASMASLATITPFLWMNLHDYQKSRITTLFDPWADPLGSGYHTIQSIIAIGSGGVNGKGWLNGTQSRLDFIPERSTDFIFSVFAEEFGLIGVILLLCLYMFILLRCLQIALTVQYTYSRLLGGGLIAIFFFYLFVNIGMVSGILPVVGVPLPLMSYGGTSMVTLMSGFGIIMSIAAHKKLMY